MNKRPRQILMLCILGFLLGTGVAWYQVNHEQYDDGAKRVANIEPATGGTMAAGTAVGGPFSLVDHDGNAVTEQDYAGSYKLVFFGFTYCPDICPAELQKIASVMSALGPKADKITPLFITVDPARDTPSVMKQYVGMYDDRIIGLTGSKEQIAAAKKAYKVYAAMAKGDDVNGYTMNHSSYTFFLGPDGALVDLFTSGDKASDMTKAIMQEL